MVAQATNTLPVRVVRIARVRTHNAIPNILTIKKPTARRDVRKTTGMMPTLPRAQHARCTAVVIRH